MTTRTKIWLGVGAFVLAGSGAVSAHEPHAVVSSVPQDVRAPGLTTDTAVPRAAGIVVAQQHDAHPAPAENAEEGGEDAAIANLPPDLGFSVRLALLKGHLAVGDELVKQGQWNAALPHFLHPTEEIYDAIRDKLAEYKVPSFDTALKTLAEAVKAKKGGADYAKAFKPVNDAVAAAVDALKAKQEDWNGFITESAIESIKAATSEYKQAIVAGRIGKPVEYQDARGFVWQADRMIESVASGLEKKDAASLKQVRAGFAELKKAFPAAMPPRKPVMDHATLLGVVSKIELAAGKLM
jgi:hypothetical protein